MIITPKQQEDMIQADSKYKDGEKNISITNMKD